MAQWNLWHGCHKISAGCQNCYVYRSDARHERDASVCAKTQCFYDPIRKKRDGSWKIPAGEVVWTCFTSDFFLEDADPWREEAWDMIRQRLDLDFFFITKRIHRFYDCVPDDWGDGWDNVAICCTCENQDRADFRLPIYIKAPIKHKSLACEPLLEALDLTAYLDGSISQVVAGGESGPGARLCKYEWILSLRDQCVAAGVPFMFKQTGARLEKDGKIYSIPRRLQHKQARKAGINYRCSTFMPKGRSTGRGLIEGF